MKHQYAISFLKAAAVSTTAETTSNIWQSDKRSGSVPDMTSPPITTGQRSHTPGDNNVTLAIGASSGGGPKHKGIDNSKYSKTRFTYIAYHHSVR